MKPLNTTLSALVTWPDISGWRAMAMFLGVFAILSIPMGLAARILEWSPSAEGLLQLALIAFIIPALCEEIVFRGLLAPENTKVWALVSTALFVAWHPLQALTWMPEARSLFLDPVFLFMAACLGGLSWLLRWQTRSLWPCIIFHWMIVVGWKAAYGGPQFLT